MEPFYKAIPWKFEGTPFPPGWWFIENGILYGPYSSKENAEYFQTEFH